MAYDVEEVPQFCSHCGHKIGARCTECRREMVCGKMSAPCPSPGCLERVFDPRWGDADLHTKIFEEPRHD